MARNTLAELARLRKEGKTRASTYQIDEADDGYDTVDSHQYESIQRKRMLEDDFVVDDDGQGYVDDGNDETNEAWDHSDSEVPLKPAKATKPQNGITSFFKRPRQQISTPVRKNENLADDLIASFGSSSRKRAPVTPKTPTPFRKPMTMDRPKMKPLQPILQADPVDIDDEEQDIEVTQEPQATLDPENAQMSDEPVPVRAIHITELQSDPPSSPITPKRESDQSALSSLPTPHQSSDLEFGHYDQNVVVFSEGTTKSETNSCTDMLDFYFTDFSEAKDKIMLFGRTSNSATACVIVEGLYRNVYILPSEGKTPLDVHGEVISKIQGWAECAVKARPVEKKYCFGLPGIPKQAEYLQVQVPFTVSPEKLQNLKGDSIRHVFGTNSGLFEQISVCKNIMGPGWLRAGNIKILPQTTSSCGITASVNFDDLEVVNGNATPATPKFTIMSLSLRTWLNPKTKSQEIVSLSARFFKNVEHDTRTAASEIPSEIVTGVRAVGDNWPIKFKSVLAKDQEKAKFKSVTEHRSELALLNWFMTQVKRFDPDFIIGHNLENIHFGILFERLRALDIKNWSFMGRRGRNSTMPSRVDRFSHKEWIAGRLYCDLSNDMGKSVTSKCDSWSLSEMCKLYLDYDRQDIDFDVSKSVWDYKDPSGLGLLKIIRQNELDTLLVASLVLKIQLLPLSKVLTDLAGNSWARTLSGSRVDRNEYILLHEFTKKGYIVPDHSRAKSDGQFGRTKAKYSGGLVLDPKKGLYRSMVLVMDFNSLYPSIIQEFNICFTTVDTQTVCEGEDLPELPEKSEKLGIFPGLIQSLVQRRREVKKLMKSPNVTEAEIKQFDIRQQALKLTANSMYGCLGYPQSRFYAVELAKLTTFKGREILQSTKNLAESNGLDVLYGDTDSVMINTNEYEYKKAIDIGNKFKSKVNSCYRLLEIDIDNVFSALLLNAKKKYAAVNVSMDKGELKSSLEVKGLDLRRREYSKLSKDASMKALKLILESPDLSEAISELYQYLESLGNLVRSSKLPVHEFLIRNKLGKDPKAYGEEESRRIPQVALALRLLSQGEIIKVDDIISFVVIAGEGTVADRARTIAQYKKENASLDAEYYLTHQLFPPLERICANIEGFDNVSLAGHLGIDAKKHRITASTAPSQNDCYAAFETTVADAERFKDCSPLKFKCPRADCQHEYEYRGVQDLTARGIECSKCHLPLSALALSSQIQQQVTAQIREYYAGSTVCSECKQETRQLTVIGRNCLSQNGRCPGRVQHKYTSKQLYAQLSYYLTILDMSRESNDEEAKLKILMVQNSDRLEPAKRLVTRYLNHSARRIVDLKSLFDLL